MKHKLFKEYFPVQTEEQKETILKEHRNTLLMFLKREILRCQTMRMDNLDWYERHRKNTIGIFGKINWKAVAENDALTKRFEQVSWSIDKYQSRYEALMTNIKNNTASIDEIDYVLAKINDRFNSTITKYASFAIFVLILAVICKLIT